MEVKSIDTICTENNQEINNHKHQNRDLKLWVKFEQSLDKAEFLLKK